MAASPLGTITIDASGSTGIDFEAFIRGGFLEGESPSRGSFNPGPFEGDEYFIGYGDQPSSKYVLANGEIVYTFIPYHKVAGTITRVEYGTRGSGAADENGYFVGGDAQLVIEGLQLQNIEPTTDAENAEVEENGEVHNFAIGHGDVDSARLNAFADDLDAYGQNFIGSADADIYTGTGFDDTIVSGGGEDTFTGGDGDDTVVFTGNQADYTIELSADGTELTVAHGSEGTATLTGVEKLQFADITIDAPQTDAPTVVEGTDDADTLKGTDGGDTLSGMGGDDTLRGGMGPDELTGGTGADVLRGGSGHDTLAGNTGFDILRGGSGSDEIGGGRAADSLHGGTHNDMLRGGRGADKLKGGTGGDTLRGGNGDDELGGGLGKDSLYGGSGDDVLKGGRGSDLIVGGQGQDQLRGGAGSDSFAFNSPSQSGPGRNGADRIQDFSAAEGDLIDLSNIDAVRSEADDQAFDFVGLTEFSGAAGELRLGERDGDTFVYGDVDGDGNADLAIGFVGTVDLTADDFLL